MPAISFKLSKILVAYFERKMGGYLRNVTVSNCLVSARSTTFINKSDPALNQIPLPAPSEIGHMDYFFKPTHNIHFPNTCHIKFTDLNERIHISDLFPVTGDTVLNRSPLQDLLSHGRLEVQPFASDTVKEGAPCQHLE